MKKIIIYLILNRLAIFLLAFFLSGIRPFYDFLLTFGKRWDGNSYTFIATHGYVTTGSEKNFIVFPPLYPMFIKIVTILNIDSVLAGVIISNFFFVLGMLLLYKLISSNWNKNIASLTLILISIFPTTYFFSVSYPESLFVFLFTLSLYFANKNKFLISALIGGFAAITRPFGLIIFPTIILFMLNTKRLSIINMLLTGILFAIPIIPYGYLNYTLFGNPIAFKTFLKDNWQKSFDFPWNGIVASWKRGFFTKDSVNYKYFVGFAEAIASTFAWIFVVLGFKKWRFKSPYLLYLFLGTVFFTSTGFILSAPRYLLSIPPFFILLAELMSKKKFIFYIWIPISLSLLCLFIQNFTLGQWAF